MKVNLTDSINDTNFIPLEKAYSSEKNKEAQMSVDNSNWCDRLITCMNGWDHQIGEPRPEGRGINLEGAFMPLPKCGFKLPGPKEPGFLYLDESDFSLDLRTD